MLEPVGCLDQHEDRAGNEVKRLEDAIHARLGDEIAFGVGDVPGQLTRRQLRACQRNLHHLVSHGLRNSVPKLAWLAGLIL